jgi:hypothetical protein
MRPTFRHDALVDDIDHVRLLDRAQPMRDRDSRPSLGRGIQRRLDDLLRLRV